jgi:predicted DCC family thiol-disulfide oxidoreductase YuxK
MCLQSPISDDGPMRTTQLTGHIVYDADCGFCTRSARWVDDAPVAWQALDLSEVGATQEQADNFAGWLSGGRVRALGAPAIAAALRARGGWMRPVGWLIDLPGVRRLAAVVYRVVAANRHRLPGGSAACRVE